MNFIMATSVLPINFESFKAAEILQTCFESLPFKRFPDSWKTTGPVPTLGKKKEAEVIGRVQLRGKK